MLLKAIFVFLFSLISLSAATRNVVYIYAGPGASKKSLTQIAYTIEPLLPSYTIRHMTPQELINHAWEEETALFILPGGADMPYAKALNGVGNQKLRSYVENGGAFLGFCAGSYYSGNQIDFSKGTSIEVQGERELAFFPGIVRGPLLAPYDYVTRSGARAAKIIWEREERFIKGAVFTLYCNGGGYFVDATKAPNTTVLATYDFEEKPAAIVECQVGKGKAILSGIHFEWAPELLDANESYLQPIIPVLRATDELRIELLQHILQRLDLKLSEPKKNLVALSQ